MDASCARISVLPGSGIRVLSIDAGGVRCLCPLAILKKISKIIHESAKTSLDIDGQPLKPCQFFDLICGSEYGGVLAIMLGRLQMSIDECVDWLHDIAPKLQPDSTFQMLRATAPFSSSYGRSKSQVLRNIFVSLLKEHGLSESTQLYECVDDDTICKTVVLVSDQISRSAVRLRSYASKSDGGASIGDLTIIDAALASLAGPMSSTPVAIGHRRLIAADYTGYANPSKEAFDEATRIWRVDSIKTIVSLGTGVHEQDSKLKSGLWAMIDLSANVLNDFDRVDQELYRDSRIAGFDCFRFKGPAAPSASLVSKVGRNDWGGVKLVEDLTQQYIHQPEVKSSLVACAQNLVVTESVDSQFLAVPTRDLSDDESDDSEFVLSESCPMKVFSVSKIATSNTKDHSNRVGSESQHQRITSGSTKSNRQRGGDSDSESSHSEMSMDNIRSLLFDSQGAVQDAMRDNKADEFVKKHKRVVRKIFPSSSTEYTSKIKIAVLDTGIDLTHPFIEKKWKKIRRTGMAKEEYPWVDFVEEHQEPKVRDTAGHGTHIAGILLQMAPFAELHVARVFDTGQMDKLAPERVAKAIKYAVDEWKVNIISMSFGFEEFWPEVDAAIEYAYKKNVLLLAAASNDGLGPLNPIAWPARKLGQVFCINSADPWGNKSLFNPPPAADNRDNFSAVGENIRSTWPLDVSAQGVEESSKKDKPGRWKRQSGTSVATPIAAAVAACIMQFGRMNKSKIGEHAEKVQEYRGMRQLFLHMAGDRSRYQSSDGFAFISPEKLFDLKKWSCQDTISGEIEKELQKML